jgi:restriction system protein
MTRKNEGLIENLFEITALVPWWVGVALAALAYLLCHYFATAELASPIGGKAIGEFAVKQIAKSVANIAQYGLPIVFLGGAVVSVFGRRRRETLLAQASGSDSAIARMSWVDFELMVGEHFRNRGFSINETGAGGADGGVDLVISRGADRYFVQCKHWKARQVGVLPVRELYGVMAANGAAGGYVVTSGGFTEEARRFAEGREIELIDGNQLTALMRKSSSVPAMVRELSSTAAIPTCPKCGSAMVRRTARKGAHAGNSFWGCSTFPKCRGTLAV